MKKGLSFELKIDSDVPDVIDGDAMRLRQILTNLLSNAVKFTERGAVQLAVSLEASATALRFQVRDTGIGIPAEHLEAVFEPFRQADGSMTRRYGGTGLGLTICVRLAKQMGGELTLESEEGRGSTFTLVLPIIRASADEQTGDDSSEEIALPDAA